MRKRLLLMATYSKLRTSPEMIQKTGYLSQDKSLVIESVEIWVNTLLFASKMGLTYES
ncbi:hypothetical protein SPIROBIBN47_410062 [uncultured spirochete]|uniref:Uncharacterized protein n=1 Tax=uncultured spirochete TaxID=156406 RepID=A0A3P3XLA9_9SPIR|nr:hypothetical protein SPIROBIBN47_410062 [uncultured spirochete]